jgi:hypothetical protein
VDSDGTVSAVMTPPLFGVDMTSIREIFDEGQLADLIAILRSEGFSRAWLLDGEDRAQFFFRVPGAEFDELEVPRISSLLNEKLDGSKATIIEREFSRNFIQLY